MQRMKLKVWIARGTMSNGEHETLLYTHVDGLINIIFPLRRARFQCANTV